MRITPGRYKAKAIGGKLGRTGGGTEQVAVEFEVLEGPYAGDRITWYGFMTEKTMERTLDSLDYCGWDGERVDQLTGLGTREVEIEVGEEEYEGKKRVRVQWVNQPGGRGMAMAHTMSPEEGAAFNEKMKGEMLKRKQARAQRGGDASFPYGANAPKKDGPPV